MIDSVKLTVINQVFDVRHLDHGKAVVFQKQLDAMNEPIQVCHMRQHVVSMDDVGPLTTLPELPGQFLTKELT